MKINFLYSLIFSLSVYAVIGQTNCKTDIDGSWIGKLSIPNGPTITILMNFKTSKQQIKGTFDSPDQLVKGWAIDSVWIVKDSLFADFSSHLGSGALYKGLLLPKDSTINGKWIQNGISIPLNLVSTTYEYTQKSNLNPIFNGYKIQTLIKSTPTKDQQNTGTCWSYATTSFIETEAIRLGKKPVILSPMFYVGSTYINRAESYIRMQGNQTFNEGGLTFSVLKGYATFGAIPEEVYSGKNDSSSIHDHFMMELEATKKVKQYVATGRNNMASEEYRKALETIVYKTIPKPPINFIYHGKNYTPKLFAKDKIGINPDDYIEITSYSHHPYYSKFILEMTSNWDCNSYLNVPIQDFAAIIDNALLNNYSVCWDGDIHEGYGGGFCKLSKEAIVTQKARQLAFDNYTTQDDHNMHIIGIAEDNIGKKYYIAKNSSATSDCGGYIYISREYILLKTISIMVHKNAIPHKILRKIKVRL